MTAITEAELRSAVDDIREHNLAPLAPETLVALVEMRRHRARLLTEVAALGPAIDAAELRVAVDRALRLYGPGANVAHVLRFVEIAREHEASEQADRDARDAWLRDHRSLADHLFVGWMAQHDPRQFSAEEFEKLAQDMTALASEAALIARRGY